jgi:DNA-binding NtrC family response regulator
MELEERLANLWVNDMAQFYQALEEYDKNNPSTLCSGILLIQRKAIASDKKQEVLKVINSIVTENQPPILVFLFYYHWFANDTLTISETEALILVGKMKDCILDSFPEVFKFLYMACKADLFFDKQTEKDYIEAIDMLPANSSFCQNVIKSFVHEYARNGTLNQIDPKYIKSLPKEFRNLFLFFNAVENGQLKEALRLKELILVEKAIIPNIVEISLENSITLLDQYLGIHDEKRLNEHSLPVKALLDKNLDLALKHAKNIFEKFPSFDKAFTNFSRYTLIRAQLANKNLDAANLIAESWAKQMRRYCFSDFFMARIELLKNNPEKAVMHFAKVLDFCKKNDAMNRLDFELELAIELQPKQIRFLMDQAISLLASGSLPEEILIPNTPINPENGSHRIKGVSLAVKSIKEEVKKFAVLDIPILILGETGVGKDIIANAIHEESNRKTEPFIAINCSSIAESLLQSELFGHEAGAYTGAMKAHKGIFQEAGNGTVFLDEIGDISSGLQTALLRVLESGEYRPVGSAKSRQVHCRIIAATNAQLESRVDAGTFRLDLLYRLKRLVIQVPPLRERPVDITYFADYFLNLNKDPSNNAKASQELEKAFLAYSWPGNVRELKNEMEKIRLLHSGKAFYTLEDAPFLKEKSKTNIAAGESFQPQKPKKLKKEMIVSNEEILQNSNSYFRRIEIIKKLFQQYKNLSRKEICQITGVPDLTIGRDLKNLRDENYILKVEPTKSPRTHYFTLQAKD